jgi:pre-mRNA-processing factor 39
MSVGLDFLSHPFWDKYIEFEERQEDPRQKRIFAILDRVIHIPMHQYARYFERFRQMAQSQPMEDLLEAELLEQFQSEVLASEFTGKPSEPELERALRTRIDNFHLEIFHRTQTETTKRWPYEQEIKRPYFHVTELDEAQLVNWRKYLTFEEADGEYTRITFLYERCLVACAHYEEFWLRYARWMYAQPGKELEVRNIYNRASCLYVPISRPAVRLNWALFEEMSGRVDVAIDIYKAMLYTVPGHLETIVHWACLERRQGGLDAAIAVYKAQLDSTECSISTKGEIVAEWAKLLWKIKGSVDEAREVYVKNAHWYMSVRSFWIQYFFFELDQPTSAETEKVQYGLIKHVMDEIRKKGQFPPGTVKDLAHCYMTYLLERGTKDAAKEYMDIDKEINGYV